jgi:hypothetical protein
MGETFAIAAFRSRQQVMQLVAALHKAGISSSVVTTPRAVSVGCGLSARFAPEHAQAAAALITRQQQGNLIGLYLVTRDQQGKIICERLPAQS